MTAAVGVDVGGSFLKAVRRGPDGEIEGRLRRPTPAAPAAILEAVAEMAEALGPGLPVGVGVAGLVDHGRRTLVWAPHLPGESIEVGQILDHRLGVEVYVDNDANCAAVGEHRQGAAWGARHVVMLTLGTGIGLGVLVDGRVYRGRSHAGEVGHMTVEPGGKECACGRRGCWETKVSGRRLEAEAARVLGAGRGAADLLAAAQRGHPAARSVVEEAGRWLAVGIESLALILDPEVVVVGGAAVADLLLEPVRTSLATTEGAAHRPPLAVRPGRLGADGGAVGAAVYAAEERVP